MQRIIILWISIWAIVSGCGDEKQDIPVPLAEGVFGPLGTVRPNATADQKAQFAQGESVAKRRFSPDEGLGPLFNVTFCGACHEKPVFGGAAGRYRDFFLARTDDRWGIHTLGRPQRNSECLSMANQ